MKQLIKSYFAGLWITLISFFVLALGGSPIILSLVFVLALKWTPLWFLLNLLYLLLIPFFVGVIADAY